MVLMFITILLNIVLPSHMSINTYSSFRTYGLYLSYAGLFHLGYNDGMYLKYGGKKLRNIDYDEFSVNLFNYILLEALVSVLIGIFAWINNNIIGIAFSFGLFTTNVVGYFISLFQATGEFKIYGRLLNSVKVATFFIYIVLIYCFRTDDYMMFVGWNIAVEMITCVMLLVYLTYKINFLKRVKLSFTVMAENIRSGIVLMLGNFASGLFTGIDRWFVKIFMNTTDFAVFSFAVSMENMISVLITPITITLYSHFANYDLKKINDIKGKVLLWGFVIMTAAFPCVLVIENYLKKYKSASGLIFILFSTQMFYIVIRGIFVNYYKITCNQRIYLYQVVIMTFVSILITTIMLSISHTTLAIACGTLLTAVIWFAVCEVSNPDLRFCVYEYVYILVALTAFLVCGFKFEPMTGLATYMGILLLIFLHYLTRKTR